LSIPLDACGQDVALDLNFVLHAADQILAGAIRRNQAGYLFTVLGNDYGRLK
jgi:hypothetical protein